MDHDVRNALNGLVVSLEAAGAALASAAPTPETAAGFVRAAARQCEALTAILVDAKAPGPEPPVPSPAPPDRSDSTASDSRRRYIAHGPNPSRMKHAKILIADDESAIAAGLGAVLTGLDYEVDVVADGEQALKRLSNDRFGLVLADLKMPRLDGLALLKELQQREIPTECIIITGQASIGSAVEAMQSGAYDYIEKPLDAAKLNRLKALIPKALDKYAVRERNRELSSQLEGLTHYAELTGASDSMREIYRIIDAVAPSTANVLILGESGTGKELVARALHSKSERSKGPFFALNCAALPKEILENELFGHEKGAFTGSTNEKPGAFEMASGGTLFLDEVAEMPPDIQVKLLRGIETRMVRRLGGKKEIQVDIRVVAATNKDLQQALDDGELREDLYYRLAVVEMYLPPLRERGGDIQLLANEFLTRFAQQNGKPIAGFDEAALSWILTYSWPGNVRDLKNAVERAVVLARGTTITTSDLMPRHLRAAPVTEAPTSITLPLGSTLNDARRQLALRTFASTGGDLVQTAKILGVPPSELRTELLALVAPAAPPPMLGVADHAESAARMTGSGGAGTEEEEAPGSAPRSPSADMPLGAGAAPPPGVSPLSTLGGVGAGQPLAGLAAAAGGGLGRPPAPRPRSDAVEGKGGARKLPGKRAR